MLVILVLVKIRSTFFGVNLVKFFDKRTVDKRNCNTVQVPY